MLAWRADFGVSGMADPEVCTMLVELILSEGFLDRKQVLNRMHSEHVASHVMDVTSDTSFLLLRFLTDPNNSGAEKISATAVPEAYLDSPAPECKALHEHSSLADPCDSGNLGRFLHVCV